MATLLERIEEIRDETRGGYNTAARVGGVLVDMLGNMSVSVKDYGAVGDGVTDDTDAVQACIDDNPGKLIFFPIGNYKFTDEIIINSPYTYIASEGWIGQTIIMQHTADKACFIFRPTTYTSSRTRLNGVGISNISLYTSTSVGATPTDFSTSLLKFTSCQNILIEKVYISSRSRCLTLEGCNKTYIDKAQFVSRVEGTSLDDYNGDDSCLWFIGDYLLTEGDNAGQWNQNWVTHINSFLVDLNWGAENKNSRYDTGLLIRRGDGLFIENGYFSGGRNSQVKVKPHHHSVDRIGTPPFQNTPAHIIQTAFDNVYFDGNTANLLRGLLHNIVIEDLAGETQRAYIRLYLSDTTYIGNCIESAIYSRAERLRELTCNSSIKNVNCGIDIQGAADYTNIILNNNYIFDITPDPVIKAGKLKLLKLSGVIGESNEGDFIEVVDDIATLTVNGSVNLDNEKDINITAGTVTKTTLKGNTSSRALDQYNWAIETKAMPETTGTATIGSADDPPSATITHSCPVTPTASQIRITPTSALGAAVHWWVSDVGATTFKINLDAVAGSSVTFEWRVVI